MGIVFLKATDLAERPVKGRGALLQKINLTVKAGELVVIRGGSGSGKSALVGLLAGLSQPGAGTVERSGVVAWVSQQFWLYQDLTARENLEFFSQINDYQGDCQELLAWSGLERWPRERAGQLPPGARKMLQIGVALTRNPEILILDEPTVGLDEAQTLAVMELFKSLKQADKVIVVTLADAAGSLALADRVYRLRDGMSALELVGAVPADGVEARA